MQALGARLRSTLPFGVLAYAGSFGSLAICYSKIILTFLLPLAGVMVWEWNPHLQAALMSLLAVVAVLGLLIDVWRHGAWAPLVVGLLGAGLLIGALYLSYTRRVEILGYVLLVSAAFLNQIVMVGFLNRIVRDQAKELAELNASLERRVAEQVSEIGRLDRLKRFLPGEVANLITSEGKGSLLESHRRYIACLFCDIRRFTAMTESMEPEDVMAVLRSFHERIDHLIVEHGGTIGYRAGDGVMVFFNDPVPCEDPDLRAVRLALGMRAAFAELRREWDKLGVDVGLGVGIASGFATLGVIGVEGRFDYTPIGNAVNLAARLGDHAKDGEILVSRRTHARIAEEVAAHPVGAISLKGMAQPVESFRVEALNEAGRVVPFAALKATGGGHS